MLGLFVGCRCQEGRNPDAQRAQVVADASNGFASSGGAVGDGGEADDPGEAPVGPTGPDVADEPPAEPPTIEALGAIPAWQAVVDRDSYLARRDAHGVVVGIVGGAVPPVKLGPAPAPEPVGVAPDAAPPPEVLAQPSELHWLHDDSEGGGALAIRVHFAAPPTAGTKVAVRGAWKVDEARRWYWEAETVTAVGGEAPKLAIGPGHGIAIADPPGGWSRVRTPDKAKDGDLVAFTVVDHPVREGDGWGAGNERWGELLAYVRLPGERASYGGHDLRSEDERWSLKKGGTYWITAGKVRRRDGQVPVIEAVTPPVRFP